MGLLTLGRLTVKTDNSGVTFELGSEEAHQVTITPRQVTKLEKFLELYAPHERRTGFRVPLNSLSDELRSDLKVRVRTVSGYVKVKPIDISLTGILLKSKKLCVSRDAHILTKLTLGANSCVLVGKVVRKDGNQWGLHFIETIKNDELDPPEELLCIYRILETEWLKSRVSR